MPVLTNDGADPQRSHAEEHVDQVYSINSMKQREHLWMSSPLFLYNCLGCRPHEKVNLEDQALRRKPRLDAE
jgi:hypothetical protein